MTLTNLMRFNENGMKAFWNFIEETRASEKKGAGKLNYPDLHNDLELIDKDFSCDEKIEGSKEFANRLELAEYLNQQCYQILQENIDDYNCWAWLSAIYFNQLRGVKTQRHEHFFPDPYRPQTISTNLYYRNAIRWPFSFINDYKDEKDLLKFLFTGRKVSQMGDPVEHTGGNLKILRSKSIRNTIIQLYWDKEQDCIKSGAYNRVKLNNRKSVSGKGGVRRFITPLIPRIKKSYDIHTMNPNEVINICSLEIKDSKWTKNN